MAKYELDQLKNSINPNHFTKEGEKIVKVRDPMEFSKKDKEMGAYIPTPEQNETLKVRQLSHMVAGKRDVMTMAMMKADMAALWRDGSTYQEIADTVSDKYQLEGSLRFQGNTINYHVKKMLAYWRQKGVALMDERQAMILARFDQIESLAIEGYFRSLEGKTTSTKSKQIARARSQDRTEALLKKEKEKRRQHQHRNDPLFIAAGEIMDPDLLVTTQEKIFELERYEGNSPGDPKFLALIIQINIQRGKILQLYNRKQTQDGENDAARLSDDERDKKIATILSSARERREKSANMLADPAPLAGFDEIAEPDVPEVEETESEASEWDIDESTSSEVEWD